MTTTRNAINWFEIFVADMDRATRFYETVLDISLRREVFAGDPMAVFPAADSGVGGALVHRGDAPHQPGSGGTVVYLDATGKLDACIGRVGKAGGRVITPKIDIGDPGHIAIVCDSEGNVVGLHAPRV